MHLDSRAGLRPVWSSLVCCERPLLERRDRGVAETDADGGHEDLHDGRGGRLRRDDEREGLQVVGHGDREVVEHPCKEMQMMIDCTGL